MKAKLLLGHLKSKRSFLFPEGVFRSRVPVYSFGLFKVLFKRVRKETFFGKFFIRKSLTLKVSEETMTMIQNFGLANRDPR